MELLTRKVLELKPKMNKAIVFFLLLKISDKKYNIVACWSFGLSFKVKKCLKIKILIVFTINVCTCTIQWSSFKKQQS